MSRWGVEEPGRDAFQYILDPSTDGEPLSDDDREHVVQELPSTCGPKQRQMNRRPRYDVLSNL
jgi:hypothetical protein